MSKVLAAILAGGQGERLSLLSEKRAKPAVPFAGKYRIVGKNCRIGDGDDMTPNRLEPSRLYSGITLIGKRTCLPDNLTVGRNCKIGTDLRPQDFPRATLASGETVEDRTFTHGWERDLARRTTHEA